MNGDLTSLEDIQDLLVKEDIFSNMRVIPILLVLGEKLSKWTYILLKVVFDRQLL